MNFPFSMVVCSLVLSLFRSHLGSYVGETHDRRVFFYLISIVGIVKHICTDKTSFEISHYVCTCGRLALFYVSASNQTQGIMYIRQTTLLAKLHSQPIGILAIWFFNFIFYFLNYMHVSRVSLSGYVHVNDSAQECM